MLRLAGHLVIRCNKCFAEHIVEERDMEENPQFLGERDMGACIQNERSDVMECEECGNRMSFRLVGYEYPPDALEYHESESRGCTILEEPSWEADYDPDPILTAYQQVLWRLRNMRDLTPPEFEDFVAEVFERNGMETHVTSLTRDGGRDIIAEFEVGGIQYTTYFECKQD